MPEVKMPDLGEGITSATVSMWYFSEGDSVSRDDDLVELVTDKATFNMPSPVSGRLTKILVNEGDVADIGTALAIIE